MCIRDSSGLEIDEAGLAELSRGSNCLGELSAELSSKGAMIGVLAEGSKSRHQSRTQSLCGVAERSEGGGGRRPSLLVSNHL